MNWIARMREARSWTQAHLARVTGLSERTVQRVEAGDPKAASPDTLRSIAEAFEITLPVNSPEGRVWLTLVEHADASGKVRTTWSELQEWLGPEGVDISAQEVTINLARRGYLGNPHFESAGSDGDCYAELSF